MTIQPYRRTGAETLPIDVLDTAVELEMRGLIDETTEADSFEVAARWIREDRRLESSRPAWAAAGSGIRRWIGEVRPSATLMTQGMVYGLATLFIFFLLWFSDLSRSVTPTGGVLVALAVYVASAGWSRIMSVYAGGVIDYSRTASDYFVTMYFGKAALALVLLLGGITGAYLLFPSLLDALGSLPAVLASVANLTLFWLSVALVVSQRKAWLVGLFGTAGLGLYFAASGLGLLQTGWQAQGFLAGANAVALGYVAWRAVAVRLDPPRAVEEYRKTMGVTRQRGLILFAFGIGYGFLILTDFAILAVAGYFASGESWGDGYLVLKLVSIVPLVLSLGAMELFEFRLSRVIERNEDARSRADPILTGEIRRAFLRALAGFAAVHALVALATVLLLLPGMPFGDSMPSSAASAELVTLALLSNLGIMFAVAGVSSATLLGSLGRDGEGLQGLAIGIVVAVGLGAFLYSALGVLGPTFGFASGAAVFAAVNAMMLWPLLKDYSFLSFQKGLE